MRIRDKVLLFEAYCENEWLELNWHDGKSIGERDIGCGTYAAYRNLYDNKAITGYYPDLMMRNRDYKFKLSAKGILILTGLKREFELIKYVMESNQMVTLKQNSLKPITTTDLPAMVKQYRQLQNAINQNED
jgi:hypothetical protein